MTARQVLIGVVVTLVMAPVVLVAGLWLTHRGDAALDDDPTHAGLEGRETAAAGPSTPRRRQAEEGLPMTLLPGQRRAFRLGRAAPSVHREADLDVDPPTAADNGLKLDRLSDRLRRTNARRSWPPTARGPHRRGRPRRPPGTGAEHVTRAGRQPP